MHYISEEVQKLLQGCLVMRKAKAIAFLASSGYACGLRDGHLALQKIANHLEQSVSVRPALFQCFKNQVLFPG